VLLNRYEPEIVLPRCDVESQSVNVIGHLGDDIGPVLPYLNATHPGALFRVQAQILRFRFEGHMVTLQPRQIAVGGLVDGDEAVDTLARLQRLINDTWEHRAEIEPSTLERKRLNPLAVYKLLPGTNCGACDQPTCLVFASKLVVRHVNVERCVPLGQEAHYQGPREQLQAMIDLAPAD
jgi:ArsR family metal-binding transcriptional regulator